MLRHLDPVSPEEASNEEEESYDQENVNRVNIPQEPTKKEYDEHMATHWPFRFWCPFCVMGRGKSDSHKHNGGLSDSQANRIPIVSVDYMFMTKPKGDEDRDAGMPTIVMVDRDSGHVSADMLPEKGNFPNAVKRLSHNLQFLGYKRLILKSDQEPAIINLKAALVRERPEDIMTEESPVNEHQANGQVERAVRIVQGQIRTMRGALQARINATVRSNWDICPWLVRHAAATISRFKRGEDGNTPHMRIRGREFKGL